ncbi:N-carbamoylputrescine amidase [Rhizobium leguminosarum]|uniref:N-carbamoylputrescine amidase n=1 Tax=Rhizobium leguminosarum TaxID=384 RepID=A0AAE2SXL7_RHILE|nr:MULTISPECIES: carbon-nitrogen hydrolase family protein [Rhizobium]MBB4291520.1 N-carbamoylputrescine amidase [Rhizobium leguminosarum]MBB4296217.1 N-carbamoylputrescine amidase [Rhizobium leguminosarum]MBB4308524.1 N-carbamoylputrescine amidase [Rhizobium leguminosarum]MBB4416359.1 N-carbamoylputrescine amidase [Rhizobium leguminosarum]MBB4430674.1 N-carbamoylputrescine amidase [Rhizobium esperanzae]
MQAWSVEWPEGLTPEGELWAETIKPLANAVSDVLVTNEMPFGHWHPTRHMFNVDRAREWADIHERGLDALSRLPFRAVISSRPILSKGKLVNEAFALVDGRYEFLHQKHYFPAESGWQEQAWFETERSGFDVAQIAGIKVGTLLCTELMFPEKARWLGRLGADLIAVPRATGLDHRMWRTAASMAAIVSGAYVISSNRVGQHDDASPRFGGGGIIVDTDGNEVGMTARWDPAISVDLDMTLAGAAKSRYPVYVRAPDENPA